VRCACPQPATFLRTHESTPSPLKDGAEDPTAFVADQFIS
jgi:hypothetical protein